MLGGDALLDLAADAVRLPGNEGVELLLERSDTAVTRFAASRVHQSTARLDGVARARVVLDGGRVGVVATNDLSRAGLLRAAEQAREAAQLVPADPLFPGLTPAGQVYEDAPAPDEDTVGCPAGRRAELVAQALAELPSGVEAAGAVQTGVVERCVVSSLGLSVYGVDTSAGATVLATGGDASGWAEAASRSVGGLDLAALGRRAGEKVLLGHAPVELPPGRYPVVLEGLAVADLLVWLGELALAGQAFNEDRSALSGRLGEQVCSPLVTVVDDPLSIGLPGTAFDAEGTPRRRTPMVSEGRAVAAVAGTTSSGHALPAPNPSGGAPQHLVLSPGTASLEELVSGLERGLLVTRFHYTNVVHPVHTTITGMTRDGTFLVEDGRVVGGVRNLRFTESVLGALLEVEAVGADVQSLNYPYPGCAAAPALRLAGFAFTSTTAY
jgi:PmbA protein